MKKLLLILSMIVAILLLMYLGMDFFQNNAYIQQSRIQKLLTYLLVVLLIVPSTIVFQTIVGSRYLSPNLLGIDAIYVFIQSFFYYIGFRLFNISTLNTIEGYVIQMTAMLLLFYISLTLVRVNWTSKIQESVWLMVGLVLGSVLRNISSFFQVLMDPNEYTQLQAQLIPSFQKTNAVILWVTIGVTGIGFSYFFNKRHVLDVYHLGKEMAMTLGVEIVRETKRLLIVIVLMIGTATALVGPLTFLGFMVANLTYVLTPKHQHTSRFAIGILIGIIFVLGGQILVERALNYQFNLSIIIEGIGGLLFFILLWRTTKLSLNR